MPDAPRTRFQLDRRKLKSDDEMAVGQTQGIPEGRPPDCKLVFQKESWLGGRDSNPDNVVQSHVSYR